MSAASRRLVPRVSGVASRQRIADSCKVYREGDELYAAMPEDIARASDDVRRESYIIAATNARQRFGHTVHSGFRSDTYTTLRFARYP